MEFRLGEPVKPVKPCKIRININGSTSLPETSNILRPDVESINSLKELSDKEDANEYFRLETITPISRNNPISSSKPILPPKPKIWFRPKTLVQVPKPKDPHLLDRFVDLHPVNSNHMGTRMDQIRSEDKLDNATHISCTQLSLEGVVDIPLEDQHDMRSTKVADLDEPEFVATLTFSEETEPSAPNSTSAENFSQTFTEKVETPSEVVSSFREKVRDHSAELAKVHYSKEEAKNLTLPLVTADVIYSSEAKLQQIDEIQLQNMTMQAKQIVSQSSRSMEVIDQEPVLDNAIDLVEINQLLSSPKNKEPLEKCEEEPEIRKYSPPPACNPSRIPIRKHPGGRKDSGISLTDISELSESPRYSSSESVDGKMLIVGRKDSGISISSPTSSSDSSLELNSLVLKDEHRSVSVEKGERSARNTPFEPMNLGVTKLSGLIRRFSGSESSLHTHTLKSSRIPTHPQATLKPSVSSNSNNFPSPASSLSVLGKRKETSLIDFKPAGLVRNTRLRSGSLYFTPGGADFKSFSSVPDMSSGRSTPSSSRSRIPVRVQSLDRSYSRCSTPGLDERRRQSCFSFSTLEVNTGEKERGVGRGGEFMRVQSFRPNVV